MQHSLYSWENSANATFNDNRYYEFVGWRVDTGRSMAIGG